MKTLRQILVVLAAGVVMAQAGSPVDPSASHQGNSGQTAPITPFSLTLKNEPQIGVGPYLQFTGLLVDVMRPKETWHFFDPALAPVVTSKPALTPPPLSVGPPHLSDDLAVHQPHFVILKISFP
jgi:hypothetical protein